MSYQVKKKAHQYCDQFIETIHVILYQMSIETFSYCTLMIRETLFA